MVWLAVTCLALAACGDEPGGTAADPTAEPGDRYTTTVTVHDGFGPPQLCTFVLASYPPQCGEGIEVVGWDWTGLDGHETAGIVRWGEYVVIGTYDGERFTITESPTPPVPPETTPEPPPATTPCPPPPDGWGVVDAATTGHEALDAAVAYAEAQPDYAALWLDSSILNVRFTGNLERHERALRAIWGGALCVSMGERTAAEVEAIRVALCDELGPMVRTAILAAGRILLEVVVDDGLQQRLDQRYGPGLVEVSALLEATD
jgi:hypothetical protein